jgi:ubiquinol-cytochrome c reductase cytochrome b subunit
MVLGAKHVESPFIELGQLSTAFYFIFFIFVVPVVTLLENTLMDIRNFGTK